MSERRDLDIIAGLVPQGSRVLDLGCGTGLVGVFALVAWPDCEVVFQDLNAPVLLETTARNVALSAGASGLARSRFVAGAWEAGPDALGLPAHAFDLVATADTLYEAASYPALLRVASRALVPGAGRFLVSAKRVYFGCSGSVEAFRAHIARAPPPAALTGERVLRSVVDGGSNVRDVIEWRRASR